jgi:hypothetical protein
MEKINLRMLMKILDCDSPGDFWFYDDCEIDDSGIRAKPMDKGTEEGSIGAEWDVFKRFEENIRLVLPCTAADVLAWAERMHYLYPLDKKLLSKKIQKVVTQIKANRTSVNISLDEKFAPFENLRANEISFMMMNDGKVKIVTKKKNIYISPEDLGLKLGSRYWKFLEQACANYGDLSKPINQLNKTTDREKERKKIATFISRLRCKLIDSMGLVDDPIHYSQNSGYHFTFKIMTHEEIQSALVTKGDDAMDHRDNGNFNEENNYGDEG